MTDNDEQKHAGATPTAVKNGKLWQKHGLNSIFLIVWHCSNDSAQRFYDENDLLVHYRLLCSMFSIEILHLVGGRHVAASSPTSLTTLLVETLVVGAGYATSE